MGGSGRTVCFFRTFLLLLCRGAEQRGQAWGSSEGSEFILSLFPFGGRMGDCPGLPKQQLRYLEGSSLDPFNNPSTPAPHPHPKKAVSFI